MKKLIKTQFKQAISIYILCVCWCVSLYRTSIEAQLFNKRKLNFKTKINKRKNFFDF